MEFGTSVVVAAPVGLVWSVYADVERWPSWTASVTSVELLTPGPLALGSRARVKQPRLPTTVWRVVELDQGRSWTWEARGPGVLTTATHRVDPAEGGSLVTLGLVQAGWLGGLVGRFTAGLTDRYLALEAEGLKARAESR
ncbi:SRPBCC family protein [Actinokineospora bangkokensis]|uniref:Polyketide cyclase n=1 Tax=Actinokineospora bangkokensis TaxID=1193682 RepID=A0A1Q9LH57_9PSEU|nr:SRPBCC family protein [Actinokineospora bangkokensis]OLR91356.1 polyketide cyclase [Actinokineospora bangkokensis]